MEPTHTREIPDPITKDTPYIFCLFNRVVCSPNSKGQIKDVKKERMALKLWYALKMLWDKRKEVLTYKRPIPKSKGIS